MTREKSLAGREHSTSAAPKGTRPDGSKRQPWLFRGVALGMPFLILVVIELGLRIAGYGYPTSFFIERHQDGEQFLIENPKFGWRFFPPSVARAPQPLSFPVVKPFGTIRIFLFGESAAMGDPEPAYGFGRQLQRLLQARHPDKHFDLVNVAMTAINSHVIRAIALECAKHPGDVWVIYAGNNEVIGPFGAGTVFGTRAPGLLTARAILFAKKFRLGQFISSLSGKKGAGKWEGMEFFLQNQVSAKDSRLKTVYDNFGANLGDIVEAGNRAGAKIVIGTVAVNLKDNPPFASAHAAGLKREQTAEWDEKFQKGRHAEDAGDYAGALAAYREAAQLDPDFAELAFRRAQCELALGDTNSAAADFSLARDLDVLRFRADSKLEELIRNTARPGVVLVDTERELAKEARDGIPGDDQFYDHVHPNFSGNYHIARFFARAVEQQLFPANSAAGSWLPESEMAHQLAFTDFDRRRIAAEMQLRLRQPPFSTQSNFAMRDKEWDRVLASPQAAPADLTWEYRAALSLAPEDWVLRANFGRLLEAAGDKAAAAEQWSQVAERLPDEPEAHFHLGNLSYDLGAYLQSEQEFRRVMALTPNSIEALSGLGLTLAALGQTNAALGEFETALRLDPAATGVRVNRAVLLAQKGNLPPAISEYESVLRLDTNNIAARINLARILLQQGKIGDAVALYTQAIQIKPDNAIAQFDLGNALSAQGNHAEALAHYAAAVAAQPGFADAQFNLALEQSRFGKISEALPHFAQAARLRPADPEVRFNYGVALAKVRRFDEAIQEFQATLKIQPTYPGAAAMLTRAQQLSAGPLQP